MSFLRRQSAAMSQILPGYVIARTTLVRGVAPDPVVAGEFPRYLYREEPDGPGDSGWRIFVGDEVQADADDPSNFCISAVSTLVAVHPELAQLLVPGVLGGWEWNDALARYVTVVD
ncbi:MAG TPA: DUF2185 domain-containing protein [Propionicimonas sp.]|jgi:hypothetical protein